MKSEEEEAIEGEEVRETLLNGKGIDEWRAELNGVFKDIFRSNVQAIFVHTLKGVQISANVSLPDVEHAISRGIEPRLRNVKKVWDIINDNLRREWELVQSRDIDLPEIPAQHLTKKEAPYKRFGIEPKFQFRLRSTREGEALFST